MKEKNFVRALVESGVMLGIGVVLSMLKLLHLPYGGSITLACMLPVVIIAYRHGLFWGLCTGAAFGIIEQLLGLKNLSYVTGWQSVVAVILLDYVVAYALSGFGGIFRKPVKNQAAALALGALLSGVLRFLSHLISGATVWAGLSIPTEAALIYSAGYNATYMIPETIIMTLMAFYLGSVLDFRSERLRTLQEKDAKEAKKRFISFLVGGVLILAAVVFAVVTVFGELQDPESGDFMITGLQNVDWRLVAMVSGGLFAAGLAVILILGKRRRETAEHSGEGKK